GVYTDLDCAAKRTKLQQRPSSSHPHPPSHPNPPSPSPKQAPTFKGEKAAAGKSETEAKLKGPTFAFAVRSADFKALVPYMAHRGNDRLRLFAIFEIDKPSMKLPEGEIKKEDGFV